MLSADPALRPFRPLNQHYLLLHRLSDELVVPSESVANEIRSFCNEANPRVVYTGIEKLEREALRRPEGRLPGSSGDGPVVCFIGELRARKGLKSLVEAAHLVVAEHPTTRFVVAGNDRGELRPALVRARELGVEDRMRYLGFRNDALSLLASSDLFVLPSLSDPFPVVALEAMALGVPAVVTRSGGAVEMHVDGETGLVVNPESPAELAGAINRLLREPELARQMGAAAQNRAREQFSLAGYGARFEEVFLQVSRAGTSRDRAREAAATILRGSGLEPVALGGLAAEFSRALRNRLRRRT
jgi:1,4-alpha-glucan branching enzyme